MLKQPTKVINTPNSLIPNYLHFTVISVAEVLAPQMPSSKLPESSLVPPALRMAASPTVIISVLPQCPLFALQVLTPI